MLFRSGFVAVEFLFKTYHDLPEGDLTRMRASLVCEQSLYEVAKALDLGRYLKLGRGEETGGGRERQSILADAVEALFAAIYLDGGIEEVRSVIWQVLLSKAPAAEERRDYKTTLQEVVQRRVHRAGRGPQQKGGRAGRRPGRPGADEPLEAMSFWTE